ncbi:transposase [Agrobacterium vitis]|uniref:transposase n=1 Tax=Agrobacterium vitis TaxID=373 RepID=UPI001572D774|nr:transposase [Agrobacterium vitis]NSZ19935.1 transposase [Agrobacterium vitis]QZO07637.1 transposase [Agrobacterium vitis]UJL90833.1 transposase [Agrobacterium vitis]
MPSARCTIHVTRNAPRVRQELTAGQTADAPMAEKLLSNVQPGATILADKAYDTDAIRNFAKQHKCWASREV